MKNWRKVKMFEFGRLEPLYRDAISVKQKERVQMMVNQQKKFYHIKQLC